jgi:hypothetical protein
MEKGVDTLNKQFHEHKVEVSNNYNEKGWI